GASPGASTAVPIMLALVEKCFPDRMDDWTPILKRMIPTYGQSLADQPELALGTIADTAETLHIHA
ncbi:MAG: malate:quinone oxidoreductase, partial [Salinibacterium sp.]|nr:malate:quinone oxidoreductase [Salinibacterium sp.]